MPVCLLAMVACTHMPWTECKGYVCPKCGRGIVTEADRVCPVCKADFISEDEWERLEDSASPVY